MKVAVGAVLAFALAIPAAVLALVLIVAGTCGAGASSAASTATGSTSVAVQGWKGEQLVNAATIINTIAGRGLSSAVQVVAITAAMGESSLVNLNHDDDARNPDGSIADGGGLFQQQVSQGWGTWEQVTNPAYATNTFVDRLVKVSGWESMPVTIAINRVQGNSDPQHYAKFEADAREVVAALTGGTIDAGTSAQCTAGSGNYPPATGQPPGPWGGFQNGRINESTLTQVPWDTRHRLRADATAALIAMNAQFRAEFGYDLPINDGYRDYPNQVKAERDWCARGNCAGAAPPGTSNHGWALAIDIGDRGHTVIGYGHAIYAWLKTNAGRFGWAHPDWAEPGGRGPHEAWHWEFYGTAR